MTENILPFKPRTAAQELEHEEYLEMNRKQAINSLKHLLEEVEAGKICGLVAIGLTPPSRDGNGYRLVFNDLAIDYSLTTIGALESVKQRITVLRDDEYGEPELEELPPTPDPDTGE